MKKAYLKKLLVILISVLTVCLAACAVTLLVLHRRADRWEEQRNEALQELYDHAGLYDPQSIVLTNTTKAQAEELARVFGAGLRITSDGRFAALTLPEGVTVIDIYENRENRKYIQYLTPDYQAKISDLWASDSGEEESDGERLPVRPQYTVSDTDYDRQTHLDYLNMGSIWSETRGSGITVAVIDTGIDTDHPEFAGRISEYSYNATEDKIVKDWCLENGSYDWSLIEDEQGHGTAVAGAMAAAMNGSGVVGIAPEVRILVIKAECYENGVFKRSSDLMFGLYYAIERDVAVVNMSFGLLYENIFQDAAQLAYDSDVICVAAAGNDATAAPAYPAADPNVFGVGALSEDSWELADYSNYGESVDLVAPGTVYTALMGGGYGMMRGTSLSSPLVAGAMALYAARESHGEFGTAAELLYASCYDLGDPGHDFYYGYGALDVNAFLLEERGTVTFNMMSDELDNTEQVFIRSHALQSIPEPERLYAVFDGWYYDPQCTEEYVWYEDEFHTDLTLYAGWVNEDDGVPFTYVELEDGTIEIRSYTGHRRFIAIPDLIDGKEVSSIGEAAFEGETRLREVRLPKYLKRIRRSAFAGCVNLVSMAIPDTVTEIGDSAFYDDLRLSALTFGQDSELNRIGDFAFSGCVRMRTFTVPAKVTALNGTAFFRNTAMQAFEVQKGSTAFRAKDGVLFDRSGETLVCCPAGLQGSYTLPADIKTVGQYAFACTRLTDVTLSGAETLGECAFIYGALEDLVIPDSVTAMGSYAFSSNLSLRSVRLGKGLTYIPTGAFSRTALTSVVIPAGVEIIGGGVEENMGAFEGIGTLAEVTFAANSALTAIEGRAFMDSGVTSVEIPAAVETVGAWAFATTGYPSLTTLTFEDNSALRSIGKRAFEKQLRLTSAVFQERLVFLGDYAFTETGLTTVTLPSSLNTLGEGAFASCHSLTEILVDGSNETYRDVDGVVYSEDLTALVAYPAGRPTATYTVPDGVTEIGPAAFYGAARLQYTELPEGLRYIRRYAFCDTHGMERVDLPDSVELLDEYSFRRCGAKQYSLSEGLREIKAYALSENHRLTSLHIPAGVMQIGRYAFYLNSRMTAVTFAEDCRLPRISYGSFACCGITSLRVPASVSTVAQGAFMGCSALRTVTFAENSRLESISAYMFDGCDSLETITFEKGSALTAIQAHGLEGMRKLTKIHFGDAKIDVIDNFAFRFCESLTRLDIPEGVTTLGRYAFYYCTALSEVSVPSTVDYIGRFAFLGTKDLHIYFASQTLPATLAEDWDHGTAGYYTGVTDVVTEGDWKYARLTGGGVSVIKYSGSATELNLSALNLGGDVVNVGGGAFADSPVERVILPETLRIIQAEAFCRSALKSVAIPAGVTFIGRSAFADTPLEDLTFAPDARLATIEQSAFENTKGLTSVTLPGSVTALGRAIFKNSGLTSLSFAADFAMTEIPEEAFAYTHIASVTIPDSVTLINHNAFREISELRSVTLGGGEDLMLMSNVFYRTGLRTVYLPENVSFVGEYAFVGLSDLTAFTVAESNPYYKSVDGLLLSKNGRKLISVPAGRTGELTVPEGVEVIGFGAFEDSRLSKIRFPEGANILTFGYRAFYNADGITEISVPAGAVSVDYYAFAMCDRLQRVSFAEGNQLKGIYEGAFYGCIELSDILLPDSIAEISDFAFYGCRSLTEIPVSRTTQLKGVYDYAFAYTGISGDFTTPETLVDIGPYAFMGNRLTSVTVPNVNAWDLVIGIGAFEGCDEITEITLPFIGESFDSMTVTWLGHIFGAGRHEANATYVPESLKKVTVTADVTLVGAHAFDSLTWLEEINLPHSVQTIYENAFYKTAARYELTNTVLFAVLEQRLEPVYRIEREHMGAGFVGNLTLAEGLTDVIIHNCHGMTGIVIPHTVRSVDIQSCDGLTEVKLPEGVQSVRISLCAGLLGLDIPESVTVLEQSAFESCDSLAYVILPSGLTSIGHNAFYGCEKLGTVYNNSSLELEFGSMKNGYVAYYALQIVDRNGNKLFRQSLNGKTCVCTEDGFCFAVENGVYKLVRYFGREETVTLPLQINGHDYEIYYMKGVKNVIVPDGITAIHEEAFRYNRELTGIVIPGSVTSIGAEAFHGCNSLRSVSMDSGVTSIGDNAFYGCLALTEISLPHSVTSMGRGVFGLCRSLTSVTLSEGLTAIAPELFNGCYSLKDVRIPSGVTTIGSNAFLGCSSLTEIQIPAGVTKLESFAFSGCSSLTDVVLPQGLTSLGVGTFKGCSALAEVVIPDSVTGISVQVFEGCSALAEVVIPDSVTAIGQNAFKDCTGLRQVVFGKESALSVLRASAFQGCASLTSISLPDGVRDIYENVFAGCSALTEITVPEEVIYLDERVFANCVSLTRVSLGAKLREIHSTAFEGCSVTAFTVAEGNQYFAFLGGILYRKKDASSVYISNSLKEITIPTALRQVSLKNHTNVEVVRFEDGDRRTSLTSSAFEGCTNLKTVILPEGLTSIGSGAFRNCASLTDVDIPDGVTSIGVNAFSGCTALTDLTLPDGMTDVRNGTFENCTSLTKLILPDGVDSIGGNAFANCASLTELNLPAGVTSIGGNAFANCASLTELNLPAGVTSIGGGAFMNCTSLTELAIPAGVMSRIESQTFSGCTGLTELVIPEGVTSIGPSAFAGCSRLTRIVLPDSVTFIGEGAFSNCAALTELELPTELTALGASAFASCHSLTDITVPDGVPVILRSVFENCTRLTGVRFGENSSLMRIAENAFKDCFSLTDIALPDGVTTVEASAFENCLSLRTVKLSSALTSVGREAFENCRRLAELDMPDSLSDLGDRAFRSCVGLTRVSFGENSRVTVIGSDVFAQCTGLVEIDLPGGLTKIEWEAFRDCDGLTFLTLPASVTEIVTTAFMNCRNLCYIDNRSDLELNIGSNDHGAIAQYAELITDRDGNRTYRDEATGFEYLDTADGFRFLKIKGQYVMKAYLGGQDTVTLPMTVNGQPYRMNDVRGLRNVIIPEGVTAIEPSAFSGCTSLIHVVIPSSVTYIGRSAFANCTSLTELVIPDSVTDLGDSALRGCTGLTKVVLPRGITSIGSNLLSGCTALTKLVIPDGVIDIDMRAFADSSSLTEIVLPDGVIRIGERAFENCTALRTVTQPRCLTSLGSGAFKGTAYESDPHNWDRGILYFDNFIVRVSEDLMYMDSREGVVGYAQDAFAGCFRLRTAVIHGENMGILSSLTNLEVLTVTAMPAHGIRGYFGSVGASIPPTLKEVILGEGVRVATNSFSEISGVTVYVSDVESDLRWDENLPGWSGGNRVVYGDKWKSVTFYDQSGEIFSTSVVQNHQIIRQPYGKDYTDGDYRFVFVGYDLDQDGVVDSIPATSNADISARAVYRKEYRCVRDGHTPEETQADCVTDQLCTVCGSIVIHRLGHDYVGEITPPTCTEQGYTTHTCSRCHTAYTDSETQALGHTYTTAVTPPTCSSEGYTTHTCVRCAHSYTDSEVEALPHDYEDRVIPPTCTEQGYTLRTCRVCQYSYQDAKVPATYHTPGVAATCTEHQYCLVCGDVVTPALGHAVRTERIPATCVRQGRTVYSCERCDWGYESDFTPFGDHTPGEEADCVNEQLCTVCGTVLKDPLGHGYTSRVTSPTCTREGYTTHTCSRCGESYRDSVTEPIGHTPGTAADCENEQVCTVCWEVLVGKLGHDYQATVTPPACAGLGYTTHTCSRCGHSYTDNEISAFGHTPSAEADCLNDQVCLTCGDVLAEKLGHAYTEVCTPPTCTEGGYTTYTCSRCGETHLDGLTDPRGHNSGEWIVDAEPAPGVTGSQHKECTVCGAVLDTKEIEALPEDTTAEPETDAVTETEEKTEAESEPQVPTGTDTKEADPDSSGGCSGSARVSVLCLILLTAAFTLLFVQRKKESC